MTDIDIHTSKFTCSESSCLRWLQNRLLIFCFLKKKTQQIQCLSYTTHTHPFNGPLSGTTKVSWHQKGTINLDFTEARDSEWQWHQLGHMQVCISL